MALRYDYDIHWIVPAEVEDDPESGGARDDADLQQDAGANFVALFRDPDTVEALRGADPEVQDFFRESGFGLDTYDSGAPDGCFPAGDVSARSDVLEKLTENLSKHDLKGKDLNGFDFAAFLDYEIAAQPVSMDGTEAGSEPDSPEEAEDEHGRFRFAKLSPVRLGAVAVLLLVLPMVVTTFLPA